MTSAGFGDPAEAKNVFTREESKRNEVCSNSYKCNCIKIISLTAATKMNLLYALTRFQKNIAT